MVFDRTDVSQVDHVLIIGLDLSLQAEVPELVLDLVLPILLIYLLEITAHVLTKFTSFVGSHLGLLFDFHVAKNLLFHLEVESDAGVLQQVQMLGLGEDII